MPQKIKITCGKDQNTYRIVLTGKSLTFSEYVNKNTAFKSKKGEELVTAILATGNILKIERYKHNTLNDGMKGEPAVQKFSSRNGKLMRVEHYKSGMLNDSIKGEPAIQEFNSNNGNLVRVEHRKKNKRHDSETGEPAIQDFYSDGGLFYLAFCKDDKYDDSVTGEAAIQVFDHGKLIRAASYKNGELIKELNVQSYLNSLKKQAVKNTLPNLKR